MRKIDFFASEPHFYDHILPIWDALPFECQGVFYITKYVFERRESSYSRCTVGLPTESKLTLVASFGDYKKTTGDVVYMEHGIGHTYSNDHPSYAGGAGKDRVVLFLNQHSISYQKNIRRYPNVKSVIVGTPKMDKVGTIPSNNKKPIVCISFHWDCHMVRETQSAFFEYKESVRCLANHKDFDLIIHAHPHENWQETVRKAFPSIPFYENFEQVLRIADIYVNDNSSTMYEFLLTEKPVIVMNSHMYRRTVNHGIRFWDYIPGIQVNKGRELEKAILRTIKDPHEFEKTRKEIVDVLYPYHRKATEMAASMIACFLHGEDRK